MTSITSGYDIRGILDTIGRHWITNAIGLFCDLVPTGTSWRRISDRCIKPGVLHSLFRFLYSNISVARRAVDEELSNETTNGNRWSEDDTFSDGTGQLSKCRLLSQSEGEMNDYTSVSAEETARP